MNKEKINWRQFTGMTILAAILSAPLSTLLTKMVEDWYESGQYELTNAVIIFRPTGASIWTAHVIIHNSGKSELTNIKINDNFVPPRFEYAVWLFPSSGQNFDKLNIPIAWDKNILIESINPNDYAIITLTLSDSLINLYTSSSQTTSCRSMELDEVNKVISRYHIEIDSTYNVTTLYLKCGSYEN